MSVFARTTSLAMASDADLTSRRRRGKELAILLAVVLGLLCAFAHRAFAIDDPLFVWLGQHLSKHPFDFYGFDVNWYGTSMPMHEVTMNPPGAGYFIAAVGTLFGFSELALHLAFLIPAAAVCLGTYRLAADLCARPLLASLLGLLTPVFLVASTSVMCDTMMLAFWCWAVIHWRRGLLEDRLGPLILAALLASLAGLTKYFGFALVPLLAAHGLLSRRRIGRWVLPLVIPISVALVYEYGTSAAYGHGLISGARAYASDLRAQSSGGPWTKALSGLVFSGGCLATAILLGPLLSRWIGGLVGLSALLVIWFVWPSPHLALVSPQYELAADGRLLDAQVLLMAYGGAVVVLLALADLWRNRNADALLLVGWILGTLAFGAYVNWANNGRSVVPAAPAFGILLARRLQHVPSASARWARLLVPAASFLAFVLAVLVVYADARWAHQSRLAGRELASELSDTKPVFIQGHWGFQYYAEQAGARSFDYKGDVLKKNDLMVVPTNNCWVVGLPTSHARLVELREYPALPWLHTAAKGSAACFYANNIAPLPFAFGACEPDGYQVWEITKSLKFWSSATADSARREPPFPESR